MFNTGTSLTFGGSRSGPKRPFTTRSLFETGWHFGSFRLVRQRISERNGTVCHVPDAHFSKNSRLALDDLAIVVFGNKITAAICRDHGPEKKIGEGSIPVHESLCPSTRPLRKSCRSLCRIPKGIFDL